MTEKQSWKTDPIFHCGVLLQTNNAFNKGYGGKHVVMVS